jgi:hypothetical protein
MKLKFEKLFFVFLLGVLFFSNGVFANSHDFGLEDEAKKIQGFTDEVQDVNEAIEDENLDYLSERWQGFLLKNRFISFLDSFFQDLNIVFVVLFSRSYSLSVVMFFVSLLWIFTLFSLLGYAGFLKEDWMRWLSALAGTIVLAQTQLFNFVAEGAFKVMFYKSSTLWTFLSFFLIIVAIVIYYFINKIFADQIKAGREKMEKEELKSRVARQESFSQGVKKMSGS